MCAECEGLGAQLRALQSEAEAAAASGVSVGTQASIGGGGVETVVDTLRNDDIEGATGSGSGTAAALDASTAAATTVTVEAMSSPQLATVARHHPLEPALRQALGIIYGSGRADATLGVTRAGWLERRCSASASASTSSAALSKRTSAAAQTIITWQPRWCLLVGGTLCLYHTSVTSVPWRPKSWIG